MATQVLTDAFVSIAGTDFSAYVKSVTLNYSAEVHDISAMGDTSRARLAGLKDWSADIEFYQDFADNSIDETLFGLVGTEAAIKIRKSKTDAISATNPEYQGNGIMSTFPILGTAVGEVVTTSVTFECSDGVALIRDIVA